MSIRALDTAEALPLAEPETAERPASHRAWNRLRRHPSAIVGAGMLIVYVMAALVGPFLLPFDPIKDHLIDARLHPSPVHLLGTDQLGRDELARLVFGARYTLTIGFLAVAIGVGVGVPVGAISGYFGGWIDLLAQRVTDVLLAFPNILLALALVATLGPGLRNVIIAVGVSSIPAFVRLVRASTLSLREQPFVEAARALATPNHLILLKHIIPNALTPVIVQATLQLGFSILVAAGLGFLGLGVQPPTPEWGTMLGEGHNDIFSDPNLATFPGLAIFGAVLAFNLVGDGLRDALDPRLN
jgi:peptide/nickel transport system permease protein